MRMHMHMHMRCGPLQEKGWDVGQTIEKLLKNGARISSEAHEVVRIPGLLTDADMIGVHCSQLVACVLTSLIKKGMQYEVLILLTFY